MKQSTPAFVLPQIYPVLYNPDEILTAIDGTKKVQELTSNAVQFPEEPIDFMFASGAGGWGTELTLNPDGSFAGVFTDGEMGSNAPGYPNGTRYVCRFEGQFSDIRQIGDYFWSMKLTDLTTEAEVGQEWIEDGIRYVASGPYGIEGGEDFILCAPGALVDDLPGYCCYWWPDNGRWFRGEQETLSDWGLCNVNTDEGFFTTWVS